MNSVQGRWNIGVIDPADAGQRKAVVRVRRQAYAEAGEFVWNEMTTLCWSEADENGVVLGLWGHGSDTGDDRSPALLSTLRLSVFAGARAAETFLEHSLQGVGAAWPALVLSRAATAPGRHRHGLMALLRCAYLQALAATPLRSVLAVVYDSAPRLHSMRSVGYTLTAPRSSWDTEARALTPPLVALLSRACFETALDAAQTLAQDALSHTLIARAEIEARLRRAIHAEAPAIS